MEELKNYKSSESYKYAEKFLELINNNTLKSDQDIDKLVLKLQNAEFDFKETIIENLQRMKKHPAPLWGLGLNGQRTFGESDGEYYKDNIKLNDEYEFYTVTHDSLCGFETMASVILTQLDSEDKVNDFLEGTDFVYDKITDDFLKKSLFDTAEVIEKNINNKLFIESLISSFISTLLIGSKKSEYMSKTKAILNDFKSKSDINNKLNTFLKYKLSKDEIAEARILLKERVEKGKNFKLNSGQKKLMLKYIRDYFIYSGIINKYNNDVDYKILRNITAFTYLLEPYKWLNSGIIFNIRELFKENNLPYSFQLNALFDIHREIPNPNIESFNNKVLEYAPLASGNYIYTHDDGKKESRKFNIIIPDNFTSDSKLAYKDDLKKNIEYSKKNSVSLKFNYEEWMPLPLVESKVMMHNTNDTHWNVIIKKEKPILKFFNDDKLKEIYKLGNIKSFEELTNVVHGKNDINTLLETNSGNKTTILHIVAGMKNEKDLLKILVEEKKANCDLKDSFNKLPLDYAYDSSSIFNNKNTIDYLKKFTKTPINKKYISKQKIEVYLKNIEKIKDKIEDYSKDKLNSNLQKSFRKLLKAENQESINSFKNNYKLYDLNQSIEIYKNKIFKDQNILQFIDLCLHYMIYNRTISTADYLIAESIINSNEKILDATLFNFCPKDRDFQTNVCVALKEIIKNWEHILTNIKKNLED